MTAAPGDLLLAKPVPCTISVVKANRVQGGAATNCVRREICISVSIPMALFGKSFLSDCTFGKMILPHLKSSIPAGFCKLKCRWSLFERKLCILGQYHFQHTNKGVHEAFYGNTMEYATSTSDDCFNCMLCSW